MKHSDNSNINASETMLTQAADAYVARDWDGFTAFFTDDAVWMAPDHPPLIGKDACRNSD